MRRRRDCLVLTVTCLLGLACLPAAAQEPPWGWRIAANPATSWNPDLVAEYLLTGQTPHPAVVRIVAPEQSGTSLGSGVLVDVNRAQGLVLTNWHVVRDSRSAVLVQFPDGFQTAGTVVRWDEAWDLAALVIWKPEATPIPIAAAPPAIGDPLTIAGFGRGTYRAETGRCTEYLSPATGYAREFVELAATARQGDSGGPILNAQGELAGVLFGQTSGRTVGSCSTRLRTFLASVGSQGFTPTPIAEFSAARAIDRGVGTPDQSPRLRMAAATIDGPVPRSSHQAAPTPGAVVAAFPSPPGLGQGYGQGYGPGQGPGQGPGAAFAPPDSQSGFAVSHAVLPSPAELAAIFDVNTNGRAMLSAAGGVALAVIGLRTMFGGRRRSADSDRDR